MADRAELKRLAEALKATGATDFTFQHSDKGWVEWAAFVEAANSEAVLSLLADLERAEATGRDSKWASIRALTEQVETLTAKLSHANSAFDNANSERIELRDKLSRAQIALEDIGRAFVFGDDQAKGKAFCIECDVYRVRGSDEPTPMDFNHKPDCPWAKYAAWGEGR